jgi:hypothetical protein
MTTTRGFASLGLVLLLVLGLAAFAGAGWYMKTYCVGFYVPSWEFYQDKSLGVYDTEKCHTRW